MADFSGYQVALGQVDYPAKLSAFITVVQGYCTEVENGRQGQASLAANFARYVVASVGLTANFSAGGFKITNLGTPTAASDAATKGYADGLSFAAALPAQGGQAGKFVTTDGTSASWADPLPARSAATANKVLTNDGTNASWSDTPLLTAESFFLATI